MKHRVKTYLVWTFIWTWGFWGLAIVLKKLDYDAGYMLMPLMTLASFGPFLGAKAALNLTWRDLPHFLFSGTKKSWKLLVLFIGLLILASFLLSGCDPVGQAPSWLLPIDWVINIVIITLIGGGNEEPGWRGFLQPELEKVTNVPLATFLVAVIWTIWHLPLWWLDRGQNSFLVFFISVLFMALWLAALRRAGGSVLICALFHAAVNRIPITFNGVYGLLSVGDTHQISVPYLILGLFSLTTYSIFLVVRSGKKT